MYSFVILHYKNIQDTLECIASILNLKEKNKKIVVVDNCTLKEEEKKILASKVDKLICFEENLGFAKANNIGCKFAIENYHPEFLIVINNDTVIKQKVFLKNIQEIYHRTNFDILGPFIHCPLGSGSVNPYVPLQTLEEVECELRYQQKLLKIYANSIFYFLLVLGMKLKRFFKKPKVFQNGEKEELGVALHCCAIVFSKKYYEQFDTIFYNDTFLYHEESFLYKRVIKHHLTTVYSPKLEIIHKEGASLNYRFHGNNRLKLLFRTKEIIKSLNLLKVEMEGN